MLQAESTSATLTPLFDGLDVPMIGATFGQDSPRARKGDPLESHQAADSNNVRDSRALVLFAFRSHEFLADHELVELLAHTNYTPQRLRTARHELAEDGLLELAEHTVATPSGRASRVWTLRKDAA